MNTIREINKINERELQLGVKGSWHDEYKDSAYIFVGGLAYELTEGDVITIFSQWGEIMDVNLPRDKETGKTKGFGFLMYEDQRSTVLAVDNMNGAQVLGRTIRVDHTRNYRQPGKKNEEGEYEEPEGPTYNAMPPVLEGSDASDSSESEPDDIDEEDPMAAYLRNEKKAAKKKDKLKSITDGTDGADKKRKDKKRKHEGESKEERRARKEEKRAKKDAKKLGLEGSKPIRVKEEEQPDRERDMNRVREDRSPAQSRNRRREDGYEDDDGASVPTWEKKKGRGDRDDWRDGKLELERERERDRARQRERDGRSTRPDYDRERNNERGSERHDSRRRDRSRDDIDIKDQRDRDRDRYGSRDSRNGARDRYSDRARDHGRDRERGRDHHAYDDSRRDPSDRNTFDDRDRSRYHDERNRERDREYGRR